MSKLISTFWFEGPLRLVDRVCLASMVDNRMDVHLYTFGDIPNVPAGVKLHDASTILEKNLRDKLMCKLKKDHNRWQPTVNFSDLFRVMLLKNGRGMWLDTDIFLFKSFEYDSNQIWFAKEDRVRVGSPVYYLPSSHPIITEYENLLQQEVLMPNWLGFVRGTLKPWFYKLKNVDWAPPDLGVTIYGNDAFTRLAHRYKIYQLAKSKETFYHWNGDETLNVYKDIPFQFFIDEPRYIGLHIHRKAPSDKKPDRHSMWAWALDRYS